MYQVQSQIKNLRFPGDNLWSNGSLYWHLKHLPVENKTPSVKIRVTRRNHDVKIDYSWIYLSMNFFSLSTWSRPTRCAFKLWTMVAMASTGCPFKRRSSFTKSDSWYLSLTYKNLSKRQATMIFHNYHRTSDIISFYDRLIVFVHNLRAVTFACAETETWHLLWVLVIKWCIARR